ncbi:MAG: type II and III secretion system protein, partial [Gammaproteobacteria bacterium]
NRQLPGLAKLPLLGDLLFNTEELSNTKTELVIFLRPVVVNQPSIAADLAEYRQFLEAGAPPRLGADPALVP